MKLEMVCLYIFYLIVLLKQIQASDKTSINLLVLVPWPDNRISAGWDAGHDLLVGARVARNEINNRTDLLSDYEINLIIAGHEACALAGADMGIINLVKNGISLDTKIAAVLGLYCSSSTKLLSPLANNKAVDLIQLSASNSPIFRQNNNNYPHLWRFLQSASVYAQMMVDLMGLFDWKRAGVIYNAENAFNFGIANSFIEIMHNSPNKELLFNSVLFGTRNNAFFEQAITTIKDRGARVIFVSTSAEQVAKLLCMAALEKLSWPNYVWVIADYRVSDIPGSTFCSDEVLQEVLNGTITSYFSIIPNNRNDSIVSGGTYNDYFQKYYKELKIVAQKYDNTTEDGEYEYSALLYDQVWAFSLALNNSLSLLEAKNLSIANYGFGQREITDILESQLKELDFQGATGKIKFNEYKEVSTNIQIYRNQNDQEIVGFYESGTPFLVNISDPPSDEIERVTILLPQYLSIVVYTLSSLLALLVTINLILMFYLRGHHEIRATSPFLSFLIFAGCYMECLAAILFTAQYSIMLSETVFSLLCNFEVWFGLLGMCLILTTNVLKLARIFRIFNHFGKTGRFWSNISLSLCVLGVCAILCAWFLTWRFADPLVYTSKLFHHTEVVPVYTEVSIYCSCTHYWAWVTISYTLIMFLVFGLVFFAIQTRKINKRNFRDTKKIVAFVFLLTVSLAVLLTTSQVLLLVEEYAYSNFTFSLTFLSVCFICQVSLFVPKTFPVAYSRIKNKNTVSSRSVCDEKTRPHTFTRTISRRSRFLSSQLSQAKLMF